MGSTESRLRATWKESQLPARELGLQLHSIEVSSADKFESAFKEATKARSSALAVMASPLSYSNQKLIADLATKIDYRRRILGENLSPAGGLMSYGPDRTESPQASRRFCGQDSQRRETRRYSCGATEEVRVDD